jgi:hypothetical protein
MRASWRPYCRCLCASDAHFGGHARGAKALYTKKYFGEMKLKEDCHGSYEGSVQFIRAI